jgi:YfiH family protein
MTASIAPAAYLVPDWPAPPSIRALVTTRALPGNSQPPYDAFNLGLRTGEDVDLVRANRKLLVRAFDLPAEPRWLRQVHGTNVLRFDAQRAESADDGEPEADASVTCTPGVVLSILTADCLPILLCASDGTEVAAIHAGWRGLAAGVIASCVGVLQTSPRRMMGWLGPAIGFASYEVGSDVREAFLASDGEVAGAFEPTREGHWRCDLCALASRQLRTVGVESIYGGGFDTLGDSRFYSHRRDGSRSGRFATSIWIRGQAP